jgi:ABC-2 type transport system permease protein
MNRRPKTVHPALLVAQHQWRILLRTRVAVFGLAVLVLLVVASGLSAWHHRNTVNAERTLLQKAVDAQFNAQPDRHPHRMVHYGHFAMRPLGPLAAFDSGVEPFTGHTLYLEGHRQNSANFGDVRQSSVLLGFGQLTPALLLQTVAPLLLIFLGHAMVAREREAGTLRLLLSQGVKPQHIILGKLLALAGAASVILLPGWLVLAWAALGGSGSASLAGAMAAAYAVWLLLWAVGVLALSALVARARDALALLLVLWAISVVLTPRLASEVAALSLPLPTRFETDIRIQQDLASIGDGHNPDDPYFSEFRKKTLAQHGVTRIEDLPLNYKGLIGLEGERLTSQLFDKYTALAFQQERGQLRLVGFFAAVSPVIALRRLSMAFASTDLSSHRSFLNQAEQHRYKLVQSLNRLQAEKMTMAQDRSSRDNRISHTHWHGLAQFQHLPESSHSALRRAAPAAAALLAWLVASIALLGLAARRINKVTP